ncbi:aldose epimerase family protein [Rubrivirga sp.]|uniref:aldose epimerase family protein n=1 Tax=Rubrivirga sp. TaxID=1885344 RepID=UPI003B51DB49
MIGPGHHTVPDGRAVHVVEIAGGGLRARVATLGAALLSLEVPGPDGPADVALGHAGLEDYVDDPAYLGVAIGRVAGRIGGATVEVDGVRHALGANDGAATLHSGPSGLHSRVWEVAATAPDRVVLTTTSPDGEGGFPGTLRVRLAFSLADGALALDWTATTDRSTPVALTHHGYLHLDGHDAGSVRALTVQSDADRFVALSPALVPTGEILAVEGTPFDLRAPVPLGDVLDADDPQIEAAGGLDHDLLVPPHDGRQSDLRRVATVRGQARAVEVWTTEPGVHLYAGGALDVGTGKGGARYGPFSGLALETQPPADATAHPGFPDIVLRPGDTFRSRTELRFSPS